MDTTISRRQFIQLCSAVAALLGISPRLVARAYAESSNRPRVIWLHMAECTGCSEAVLKSSAPFFNDLIMQTISLDYHETLMSASGATVETILSNIAQENSNNFFCVVEGAIPTADNGVYGMIGGRTMLSIAQEICPKAKAIIALGTCSSFGGLPAAKPNPTGAKGVIDALPGLTVPVINLSGCPPNPINFIALLTNYLLTGASPPLDSKNRPLFAHASKVHSQCPYRLTGQTLRCTYEKGCKGTTTYNNCPTLLFNGISFPMKVGHPCIGCAEPSFWDTKSPFYHMTSAAIPDDGWKIRVRRIADKVDMFDVLGRRIGPVTSLNGRVIGPKQIGSGMRILKGDNGATKIFIK